LHVQHFNRCGVELSGHSIFQYEMSLKADRISDEE